MAQVTVDTAPTVSTQPVAVAPVTTYDDSSGAQTAASSNLTWAIAMMVIIAPLAIAIVYVSHKVMH